MVPVDVKGNPLAVGDFVLYTTNAEGGSLNFGVIKTIKDDSYTIKHGPRAGQMSQAYRIQMFVTDENGKPEYKQQYRSELKKFVDTDKQSISGLVQWSRWKFLKM